VRRGRLPWIRAKDVSLEIYGLSNHAHFECASVGPRASNAEHWFRENDIRIESPRAGGDRMATVSGEWINVGW
jgi:hypothetical protein